MVCRGRQQRHKGRAHVVDHLSAEQHEYDWRPEPGTGRSDSDDQGANEVGDTDDLEDDDAGANLADTDIARPDIPDDDTSDHPATHHHDAHHGTQATADHDNDDLATAKRRGRLLSSEDRSEACSCDCGRACSEDCSRRSGWGHSSDCGSAWSEQKIESQKASAPVDRAVASSR